MVASEHAQAPGIDAQTLGQAELRREVRNLQRALAVRLAKPRRLRQIALELLDDALDAAPQLLVVD